MDAAIKSYDAKSTVMCLDMACDWIEARNVIKKK